MATNIEIPAIMRAKTVETIFEPENDLRYLIYTYLGNEAAGIYDEILADYRNPEEDDCQRKLKEIRDDLKEILKAKHIRHDTVEKIFEKVNKGL